MKQNRILIYDTTLRDGTQGEQVTFSAEEKHAHCSAGWTMFTSITLKAAGPVPTPKICAF